MSNEVDPLEIGLRPKIDIWGSCVSRDTLEFMPTGTLGEYVARQSAISMLAPAKDLDIPLERLESDFQRRMMRGDMTADVSDRLLGSKASVVLIDLIDERRGVWRFPNGAFLTNSVEAYRAGVDGWAPRMGAKLVPFGTDSHYDLWKQGFTAVMQRISTASDVVILLDVAWAELVEGQAPIRGIRSVVSDIRRHAQKTAAHVLAAGKHVRLLNRTISSITPSERDEGNSQLRRTREANSAFRRYIDFASKLTTHTIRRTSDQVRMGNAHKWGVAPYHYSDSDYVELQRDICRIMN